VAISNVRVGEIILFRKPVPDYKADAGRIRVIKRLIDPEDQLVLITKGDSKSGSIPGVDFPSTR
jgi:hypothetical protein